MCDKNFIIVCYIFLASSEEIIDYHFHGSLSSSAFYNSWCFVVSIYKNIHKHVIFHVLENNKKLCIHLYTCPQRTITCSRLTIETREQGVKYAQS